MNGTVNVNVEDLLSQIDRATSVAIWQAIARERNHQDRKYGPLLQRKLSIGDYLVIMRQELAEAERAYVGQLHPVEEALREILQVAAVAVACLDAHGVVER